MGKTLVRADCSANDAVPALDLRSGAGTEPQLSVSRDDSSVAVSRDASLSPSVPGYALLQRLGEGGQGRVWLALRTADGLKAAVKVMSRELAVDAHARARFEQGFDALALLEHPGIVRGMERGVLSGGELWHATEYVEGSPLADYVTERDAVELSNVGGRHTARFPVRAVVELFVRICEALEAAHQAGLIHRDLKPSNIIVDDSGQPHLIDFGLVKTATPSNPELVTLQGEFLGTAKWASPEQVDGRPGRVDTRSDIYSLGVMLYQSVTGRFPYDVDGPLSHVFDQIRYVEPKPPRAVCDWVDADLQAVMQRALEKAPARRYQTVVEFREDLRRWLNGEMVAARRGGRAYAAWKWLRRHPYVAAMLLLTALYGGTMTLMYRSASEHARDAEHKFELAWEMADTIISEIDTRLDKLPGSSEMRRELLNLASSRLEELSGERIDDPRLLDRLASAHSRLGDVAGILADSPRSRLHLERALALRERIAQEKPDDAVAQDRLSIAIVRVGDTARASGDLPLARQRYERAWAIDERLAEAYPDNGHFQDNLCWSLERMGSVLRELGEFERFNELSRRRLEIAERLAAAEPDSHLNLLNLLAGLVERNVGDFHCGGLLDTPVQQQREERAYDIACRLVREDPMRPIFRAKFAFLNRNMAGLHRHRGDDVAAREYLQTGILTATHLLAIEPDNVEWHDCLAALYGAMGELHGAQGDWTASECWQRLALFHAEREVALSPGNQTYRASMIGHRFRLADVQIQTGDRETAKAEYASSICMLEELAADPRASPFEAGRLAVILINAPFPDLRDLRKALDFARDAVQRTRGESAPYLKILATVQKANGDLDGALASADQGIARLQPAEASLRAQLVVLRDEIRQLRGVAFAGSE